jgi:ElaB/YqjD/DUF883 family membrane-anchored ribosome-binding protein
MTTRRIRSSPAERCRRRPSAPDTRLTAAKELAAGADLDQLKSKASDAASALYQGGRDLLSNSDDLSKARDQLSDSIRKNPLAAVGIAFTAGLLLALLTRG